MIKWYAIIIILWVAITGLLYVSMNSAAAQVTPEGNNLNVTYTPPGQVRAYHAGGSGDELVTFKQVASNVWDFYITPDPTKLRGMDITKYPFEAFYLVDSGSEIPYFHKVPIDKQELLWTAIPYDSRITGAKLTDGTIDLNLNRGVRLTVSVPSILNNAHIKYGPHSSTITFVGGNITITGNTNNMRYDIYTADQLNGWNVFHTCGTACYCSDVRIDIGDGTTPSDIKDQAGALWFKDIYGTAGNYYIYIHNNTTATFGVVTDETNRYTNNGIKFFFEEDRYRQYIGGDGATARGYFNSCTFEGMDAHMFLFGIDTGHLWNCTFNRYMSPYQCGDNQFNIYNTQILHGNYGLLSHRNGDIEDCRIIDTVADSRAFNFDAPGTVMATHVYGGSGTMFMRCIDQTAPVNLYNVYHHGQPWFVEWHGDCNSQQLYRYYSLDLCVNAGTDPLPGAVVEITNNPGTIVASIVTAGTGCIPTQWLLHGYYDHSNPEIMRTPHTLTITHPDYYTYTSELYMDEEKTLEITMIQELPTAPGTTAGDVEKWLKDEVATKSWWEDHMELFISLAFVLALVVLAFWKDIWWLYLFSGMVSLGWGGITYEDGLEYGIPLYCLGILMIGYMIRRSITSGKGGR